MWGNTCIFFYQFYVSLVLFKIYIGILDLVLKFEMCSYFSELSIAEKHTTPKFSGFKQESLIIVLMHLQILGAQLIAAGFDKGQRNMPCCLGGTVKSDAKSY